MLKKIFTAAMFCLIIFAGFKVEAAEIYVGKSPATGWDCYILTESVSHRSEHRMLITNATLKMLDGYGEYHYLDYTFFDLDGDFVDVEFTNSQGYSGFASPRETPIEWSMYTVSREH